MIQITITSEYPTINVSDQLTARKRKNAFKGTAFVSRGKITSWRVSDDRQGFCCKTNARNFVRQRAKNKGQRREIVETGDSSEARK